MENRSIWWIFWSVVVTYGLVVLAQLLGAAAGLVFVNLLTKQEFALFAVFTALQQAMVAQSDLGTLGAVGYFYREKSDWSSFKSDSLPSIARVRLYFFILTGIVLTIIFAISHAAGGITVHRTTEFLCLTFGTAVFAMLNGLQTVVLRVRGDVRVSAGIGAVSSFVRLGLAIGMVSFGLISAELALIASLLSTILSFVMGRLYIPDMPLGLSRRYNKSEQRKVIRYTLPLIPGSLYYSLQPSILIWLSAIFGTTQQIAEVGAIGRIGQIIAFVGFGLELFVVPYMAALRDDNAFRRGYVAIWFILSSLLPIVFVVVALSRGAILGLLGSKYSNLDFELLLVTGTSLLSLATNYAVLVNRLRSWNKLEPLSTLAQFAAQVVLIAWLPMDSTARVLMVGLCYASTSLVVTFSINIIGFLRPAWAKTSFHSAGGTITTEQSAS